MGVPVPKFNLLPPRFSRQYSPGLLASLVIHGAIMLPYALTGSRTPERHDPIDQMVVFLVPPEPEAGRETQGEGISWSSVNGTGGSIKEEIKVKTDPPEHTLELGDAGQPDTTPVLPGPEPVPEKALSEIEVDSAVVRDPSSSAPSYPETLLQKNIEGSTFVHYVVDTNGQVDTTTIQVVRTTHPEFALSVRQALARMKFRPAIQASRKVRQWVEQNFAFKIMTPPKATPADTA
jgi:TonB family protein